MNSYSVRCVVLISTLSSLLCPPVRGQICGPEDIGNGRFLGVIPTSAEVIPGTGPLCLGTWTCDAPMVSEPFVSSIIFDPIGGTYSIEMRANLRIPGNIEQSSGIDTFGRSIGFWFEADEPTFPCEPPPPPENCPNHLRSCGFAPGPTMNFDVGDAFFRIAGISCDNLFGDARLRQYTFDLYGCNLSKCPKNRVDRQFDFRLFNVAAILRCDPPRDSCQSCLGCPIGGAGSPPACSGSPQAPGKCTSGGFDVSAGMSVAGDGLGFLLPRSGPNALLRYRARGPGDLGHNAGALPGLGRYWSHDAAERIVSLDPVADRIISLITRAGTFHLFEDEDEDDVYEIARPSSDYRRVEKTAGGWEIRFLDGTLQHHDSLGNWTQTVDPNGNTTTASYSVSGELETVVFPDGRSEVFAFGVDGKLATIDEVGIDGTTTRGWTYTWVGDDLQRVDRPDDLAWEMFYEDLDLPGYITRVELVGTDGTSRRIVRAWRWDDMGNAVATWRGAVLETDPGAVDLWLMSYDNPHFPRITTVTDPLGQVSTYTFGRDSASGAPRVTQVEGDCPTCGVGPNSQLFYDDPANPMRPTRTIDGRGTTTLMAYDTGGQMTSRVEAMGEAIERETTWQYDPAFPANVTEISQPSTTGNINDFRITSTTYDGMGNAELRTISGFEAGLPFNLTTTTTFTAQGLPDTVDPPGFGTDDVTDFDYDPARGNVILASRTDPIVGTTVFAYDPFNRRTAVTDPNGVVAETEFDMLDRVTRVIQRGPDDLGETDDLITEHRYSVFGDLFQTVLPKGNVIEYGYDHVGRMTSIERKADDLPTTHGERTFFTLDDFGHRIREELQRWDPVGGSWVVHSATEQVYATRCFLDQTVEGAGSANESVTEFAYDCEGNLERVWDANHPSNGQVNPPSTVYEYDALNRLTEVRQPFGSTGTNAVTGYDYDVQDHLTSVTDAEGTVTTYEYSDRDLLTEETSEVSGTTTFVYNEHGELTEETDARLITTTRTVDALDRVTFVDFPDDSLDITYTYDDPLVPFSIGRLTSIARNGTSVDYAYDRFGRVLQDGALAFTYDDNGNRSTIGYPSGVSTTATYDFADRPATLDAAIPGLGTVPVVTATSYLPSGPVDSLDLGNGVTETRLHDPRYHPDRITTAPNAGPDLLDWDFTTDDVGNITMIGDAITPANDRTYGYLDHQYFLTQGDGPWGSLSWTYDAVGNRLTQTRGTTTDTYAYVLNGAGGNSPQLMSIALGAGGTETYEFDDAGNQTQVAGPTSTLDSTYDDASRQTTAGDGIFQVTHRYDGRSFLERSARTNPGAIFADSFESGDFSCWSDVDGGPAGGTCPPDPPFVAPTYSSDGLLHHLLRGFGDDQRWVLYHAGRPVALVEEIGGGPAKVIFLTTDHLGTPVVAMEGSVEVWEGGFEPFGADYADGSGAGVFLRFPGQWEEVEWRGVAQSYNVHRWYQLGTGRYGRVDPLLLNDDSQAYAYGLSNPLGNIDSLGLMAKICCRLIDNIFAGSLARGRHCYLVGENGTKYSLFPEKENGETVGVPSLNDDRDKGGICKDCEQPCEAIVLDTCLRQQFDRYPIAEYRLFGPNSNTFAGTLARACCRNGVPDGLGSAPGIDDQPPVMPPESK